MRELMRPRCLKRANEDTMPHGRIEWTGTVRIHVEADIEFVETLRLARRYFAHW